jgi:hypothetical protein
VGEKVYLTKTNIKTKRLSTKLDHLKLGLFKILKKIGNLNYRLDLRKKTRIYSVFHVVLLEPAPENARTKTHIDIELDIDKYKVEEILDYNTKTKQYLVK